MKLLSFEGLIIRFQYIKESWDLPVIILDILNKKVILNLQLIIHAYSLWLHKYFLVIANMQTKSIQKKIIKYNIKSKYPEEYSTVNKGESEKPLVSKSCFM